MIFIDCNERETLRRIVAENEHATALAKEFLSRANMICRSPLVDLVFEPGRPVMLPTSRLLLERVFYLGIAWVLTEQPLFRMRLIDELKSVCGFPHWNHHHFLDTAEMLAAVAIGRDWCKPIMKNEDLDFIDTTAVKLGLRPGLEALETNAAWTTTPTNWNLVCSGALIVSAILMDEAEPELCEKIRQRATEAIRFGLAAYDDDGGWPEGVTYWEYGTKYAILALEAVRHKGLSQHGLDCADFPNLLASWRFHKAMIGPSGKAFNSGDSASETDRPPFLGWFCRMTGDAEAGDWQWQAAGRPHPLDLIWYTKPDKRHGVFQPASSVHVFRGTGFLAIRKTTPTAPLYLAAKGGQNSTNHAHLDLGTFVVDCGSQRMVEDLGREDYSAPGYFSPDKRFSYFLAQTSAHNTINALENGVGQNQSHDAEAKIVRDTTADDGAPVTLRINDMAAKFDHIRAFAPLPHESIGVFDWLLPRDLSQGILRLNWQIYSAAAVRFVDGGLEMDRGEETLSLFLSATAPVKIDMDPVNDGDGRFLSLRRLSSSFDLPASGLFIAAVFGNRQSEETIIEIQKRMRDSHMSQ